MSNNLPVPNHLKVGLTIICKFKGKNDFHPKLFKILLCQFSCVKIEDKHTNFEPNLNFMELGDQEFN